MDLGESSSKKPATMTTIAMANTPSRQKEKRKQQSWEEGGVEVIDLCSSSDDDDSLAKVSSTPKPCTIYALLSPET